MNRVGEQIGDDLGEAFGIARDFNGFDINGNFHRALVRERLHQFRAVGNGFRKIKICPAQDFLTGVEPCQREQRFDKLAHPLRRALAGLDGLLVTRGIALTVQRGLRLRQNHRDGRAQFVRRVGGELFLLGEGGFQAREGGIQDGGELAEFAFRLSDVDALGEIAGRDFYGSIADARNWFEGTGNEPPAARKSNEQN